MLSNIPHPPQLKAIAFEMIKKSIMDGSLQCGFVYSENTLSKQMGISKTPVHEALLELCHKGFVEILPKRGFRLKELSQKNIRDIYAFRLAVEKAVVVNASKCVGKKEIEELNVILNKIKSSVDLVQFMEQDINFHRYLALLTENDQIITALEGIWDLCVWIGYKTLSVNDMSDGVFEEHLVLLDCIKGDDSKAAEKAIEVHIKSSLDKILPVIENPPT